MKLLQLQRTMARAVMQPLTSSERMQRRAPDGGPMKRYASRFIKPNDRLTSFERLEIYNRQYWFRVLSALAEDFPGLRAVLGQRRFDAMAKAYLIANPSRSFTLRNLGSRMESWLLKNPKWTGPNQTLALDIARLEWADIEAFDGKAEPALRSEDLSSATGARLKLILQPYVRLLSFRYPVDDLLLEVRKEDDDTDFASNTFAEHRKRKRVRAVAKLKPARIFLAVHRIDYSVYFRRLEQEEFLILTALRRGKTLGAAIAPAFRKSAITPDERPVQVQTWFQTWAALGWFCRPEKKRASRQDLL
ncbi:MAG: DNA-binding domain-containing protein [Candidatus Acidiferrum sp.]